MGGKLRWIEERRDWVEALRPKVRKWSENFDWAVIKEEHLAAYRKAVAM